jgi:two-component system nitrate/nitrite response regulator NarL
MSHVLIYSDNPALITLWSSALESRYHISTTQLLNSEADADAVIIDAMQLDKEPALLESLRHQTFRMLIVGTNWPEEKQINALVQGAAGYCGESEPPELLVHALESILKGDIWIQRHLVPKVIGRLVEIKAPPIKEQKKAPSAESLSLLNSLSNREHDVAKMVRDGENNKKIASAMDISERTVKAHLTSIFKKLNLSDRLHLALFIKEFD